MIRNQWYVVLESKEVGKKPLGVLRMGEKLVFWRDNQGVVHCAIERCPHRGAALSKGTVLEGRLQCPFHGNCFCPCGRSPYPALSAFLPEISIHPFFG